MKMDLVQVELAVASYIQLNQREAAYKVSVELEEFFPQTLEDMRRCVSVFMKLDRKGCVELMFHRYQMVSPSDNNAIMDKMEFYVRIGKSSRELLATISPKDDKERFRFATILRNAGSSRRAANEYAIIVRNDPTNLEARKGLIESLNFANDAKAARREIDRMFRITGDSGKSWSFLAEQSSRCGYIKGFEFSVKRLETKLSERDVYSRFLLALGYSRLKRTAEVKSVLSFCDVSKEQSEWLLGQVLKLAGLYGLRQLEAQTATRLMTIGASDKGLLELCEQVVQCPDGVAVHENSVFINDR